MHNDQDTHEAYLKTYAVAMMRDGSKTAEQALAMAREALAMRLANEATIDRLLKESK